MTGRLLLDTCAIIWIATDQPIGSKAKAAMNEEFQENQKLRVSPISAWELGLLSAKGRLPSTRAPITLFKDVIAAHGVKVEALSPEVLIESSFLPGKIHSDPADRILIATAREHDLTIVTRDRAILDYGAAGHVKTLEC
jgi:PIN domain nuclease of toxin-antitoxin system